MVIDRKYIILSVAIALIGATATIISAIISKTDEKNDVIELRTHTYNGYIDKYPIYLQLRESEHNKFQGEYYYLKRRKVIDITAHIHKNSITIKTFNPENGHVEYFRGEWIESGNIIEGIWEAPDIKKSLAFNLKRINN